MVDKIDELRKRIEELKIKSGADLSLDEDLTIAVMNLISLEEHFFWSSCKTGKEEYLDTLNEVREIRKEMLARLIPKHEGETWCAAKHLLATTMRLQEVTTRLQKEGKLKEAEDTKKRANDLFAIFFGLKLKLLSLPDIEEMAKTEKPWSLSDIMNKLVNCCDE
ncbi:MAG: hypothetical protein COV07_03845 [Candidatus Vogelbacteria bacterium CG10_big_fil_rev_8_21_14_0_10_45_14]|uniref:Uncharacterized protein n=1 Tax=Candidatus Vogelbacteria bacterium CG10_big_fil_rev_8_21_14_0_10_45_14 TaxID=1975042 RepID=A0A2H0RIZ3_9BACT|nr:MAG: hypothetical protein COV07_03845 [Candidatus Vogelbacteria bacterium CG10_big_fil_rev_8_21_14_0_10_45_14]